MTTEEAIRILDPNTAREALAEIEYYGGFSGKRAKIEACNEACRIAVAALRAQQGSKGVDFDHFKNEPLTLDELREMDGEPAFITHRKYGKGWCIIDWHGVNKSWTYFSKTGTAEGMTATPVTAETYGEDWLAYRRKPKEV